MNTETPFIVLSADRAELGPEVNEQRRDLFERQLHARGLDFKPVAGVYKGTAERSYIVLTPTTDAEHRALQLARRYGQESVLLVDANRWSALVFLNEGQGGLDIKRIQGIGFWRAATKDEAEAQDAYTRDGEAYYVTTPAA